MAYSNPNGLANDIALRTEYLREIMDEIVAHETVTSGMTVPPAMIQATQNAGTFKIATADMDALGAYSRQYGYSDGSADLGWEEYKLTHDRSRRFTLDNMDIRESGGLASATYMMSEFIRMKVNPEIDVTRLSTCAKYAIDNTATYGGTEYGVTLTKANIISKMREGLDVLYNNTYQRSGHTIYADMALSNLLKGSTEITQTRDVAGSGNQINGNVDYLDGNQIVWVPTKYMESAITLYDGVSDGQTAGGWAEDTANSKHMNFLMVAPNTAHGIVALNNQKFIPKESNPDSDGDLIALRIYHDLIVTKQRLGGLFASFSEAASA